MQKGGGGGEDWRGVQSHLDAKVEGEDWRGVQSHLDASALLLGTIQGVKANKPFSDGSVND